MPRSYALYEDPRTVHYPDVLSINVELILMPRRASHRLNIEGFPAINDWTLCVTGDYLREDGTIVPVDQAVVLTGNLRGPILDLVERVIRSDDAAAIELAERFTRYADTHPED